ncbi:hypothetical protein AMTRI_Chr01g133110 [Amborella trichopoda]|uniref:TCP domain-containing protein n=1 Tax=Amborella trichopoda TaxID=13333 RepID=W1PVB3_AMBTC|nr:transcription factor TCP4 [Amborella trichopoda]ERN13972.1 hypothetical protein AMTR_s00021p00158020 [Amborella trichopoda]|eukprot:XP_011626273.1 transcription factor TCP4 [Amborella trichopoda]
MGERRGGNTVGEIVEVEGGHIVRSTGRKDRHSKVCTAKGPRDRRVRLSAHTAIQFYDVQDRLGYDRPSKAVDWLIKKAKPAIDELAELPAWQPTAANLQNPHNKEVAEPSVTKTRARSSSSPKTITQNLSHSHSTSIAAQSNPPSSFLLPPMETETMKPFSSSASSSSVGFLNQVQNYPPDLLSRSNSQELRLSLQSLHDPHHQQMHPILIQPPAQNPALQAGIFRFSNENPLPIHGEQGLFWSEQHHPEFGAARFQRVVAWNSDPSSSSSSSIGFVNSRDVFNSNQSPIIPSFGHHSSFTKQRGPLQSSHYLPIRARELPPVNNQMASDMPMVSSGFSSGGFSGFRIPARIQGEEEEHDGVTETSAAASTSRHP